MIDVMQAVGRKIYVVTRSARLEMITCWADTI